MKFNLLTKLYNKYGENPGKMLVVTGTIGWILSCAAQAGAILFNDKIDKRQKAFLIPQELGDGLVNVLSFLFLTSSIKNIGSKLVSTGKISNKAISNFLKKYNLTDKIGKIDFNIEKLPNYSEIKPEYKAFKNGTDVVASVVGSVISCNFVTPVLRNKIANHQSKILRESMDLNPNEKKQTTANPYGYYTNTMTSYMNRSGNMKV